MIEVRRLIGTPFLIHLSEDTGNDDFWNAAKEIIEIVLELGLSKRD